MGSLRLSNIVETRIPKVKGKKIGDIVAFSALADLAEMLRKALRLRLLLSFVFD